MNNEFRRKAGKGCGICSSPDRARVEEWLVVDGDSVRFVAERSGFSRRALKRHLYHHKTLEELKTDKEAG